MGDRLDPADTKVFESHLIESDKAMMCAQAPMIVEATLGLTGREINDRIFRLEDEKRRMEQVEEQIDRILIVTKNAVLQRQPKPVSLPTDSGF